MGLESLLSFAFRLLHPFFMDLLDFAEDLIDARRGNAFTGLWVFECVPDFTLTKTLVVAQY